MPHASTNARWSALLLAALVTSQAACAGGGGEAHQALWKGDSGAGRPAANADAGDAAQPAADAGDAASGPPRGVANCPPGSPLALNRARLLPAPGRAQSLVGGQIEGSNLSPTNGFVPLATVETAPRDGSYVELKFQNQTAYRYVKYYAPDGSYGAIAELELYHDDVRLSGLAFGSAGDGMDGGSGGGYQDALDGNPATFFATSIPNGNYVGLDIGANALTEAPVLDPPGGTFPSTPLSVTLSSKTAGAQIRYTLDGSSPSRDHGSVADGALTLPVGRTQVKAIAYSDCLFDSAVVDQTYYVGVDPPVSRGLTSYHVGNSLTDTINPWLKPIADSTGVDHTFYRWTIPGAPPDWLWTHQGEGFGDPPEATQFNTFVHTHAPIDHMTVQPFSDPTLELHGNDVRAMYTEALSSSPNLQLWIYAQWPWHDGYQNDGLVQGAPFNAPKSMFFPVPKTWEDAVMNQQKFHERFRAYVDEAVGGKTVLVIPAGLALVNLKHAIEAGQVPGIRDFVSEHFADELHLSSKGQYLVSLVFYSCFYKQSAEGRATFADTGLTEEQALIYQRIAWQTVQGYAWSGIGPTPTQ